MNVIEGKMTQDGIKVGIVVARFNEFITAPMNKARAPLY